MWEDIEVETGSYSLMSLGALAVVVCMPSERIKNFKGIKLFSTMIHSSRIVLPSLEMQTVVLF